MKYKLIEKGDDMAIFNERSEAKTPVQTFQLGGERQDDFDVSLRYITDLSSYRSSSDFFEILVVADGDAKILLAEEQIEVTSRNVGFFFPGDVKRIEAAPGSEVILYSLLISPYLLTEFCNLVAHRALDMLFSGNGHRFFRMHFRDFEYFVHLAELTISAEKKPSLLLAKRAAYNLVSQLILSIDDNSVYPDWFEIFLEKIHLPEYFLSPMSEIYKLAPYSQPMLNSYFNRFMGETLVSYITKMKINYACNLLRFSELTVVDIASKTKYSSLSHFNHIFKKQIGMTPSEYRINNSTNTKTTDD